MKNTYFIKSIVSLMLLFVINITSAQSTFTIGTGNLTSSFPFHTYYHDAKTQMLYSASELNSAGSYGGMISAIALNVTSAASQTMNGFTIKIQQTTQNSLSGFISTGFTTVYTSNYSVNGTGWKTFNFSTPFLWDGTKNIVIQICYNNTSYTSNSNVASSNISGKTWYAYTDGGVGCSLSGGGGTSTRPNMKFTISSNSSNDLAAVQIVSPTNNSTASATMPFSIKVRNVGSSAQSGYTVKYSIDNGSSWKSQTISSSLASYADNTVSFVGTSAADMSSAGLYQCIGVVEHSGDTISYNDTIRENISICTGTYSGTYTIGTSSSDDFPTLAAAISSIKNCGIGGPIDLKIKPGTYTGNTRIGPLSGISSTNTITIESYTGNADDVILQYQANGLGDNYVLRLDTIQEISIKNITFKSLNQGNFSNCLTIYNSSNCSADGNKFINKENLTVSSNNILVDIRTNTNSVFSGISFTNNTFKNGYRGLSIIGASSSYKSSFLTVENNEFINYKSYGLFIRNAFTYLVKKNVFKSTTANAKAIIIEYVSGNQRIEKNRISTINQEGIYLYYAVGSGSLPIYIANNFVSQSNQAAFSVSIRNSNYVNFYNNSIYSKGNTSNSYSSLRFYNSTYVNMANNNIINVTGGRALYVYPASGIITSDYNNYYVTGNYLAAWGNNNITNLVSLKSVSGKETHSINNSVSFYSDEDLHVIGSTLNGLGTHINTVTDDIDGETRNATTPDIGADEYTVYQNDAGISEFVNLANACPGSSQSISVKLNNYGMSGIANVNIGWSVNGVAQSNYTWIGLLGLLNSTTATIGSYNFSGDSTYTLKAWINTVNLVTDSNAINDTALYMGHHTSLSGGSYIIGSSSSADYSNIQSAIDAVNEYGICGPIVFEIENGNYSGQYTLDNISGTNSTNTITFQSLNGDTSNVRLIGTGNTTANAYVFKLENADYINFKNLSFYTNNALYSRAISIFNASSHITVDSCNFIGKNTLGASNTNVLIMANKSSQIVVSNSNFKYGESAIFCYSNGSTNLITGINLLNNTISSFRNSGVYVEYTGDSLVISGNTFIGASDRGTQGITTAYTYGNTKISKNKISLNSSSAYSAIRISRHNNYNTNSAVSLEINNNYISVNTTNTSTVYGVYLYNSYYTHLNYNTIKVSGNVISSQSAGLRCSSAPNTYLKNNIIDVSNMYAIHVNSSNYLVYSNYNAFNSQSSTPFYYNYSNYSFSNYKSYSGKDGLSKFGAINYLNSGDYHVHDLNLNNAGSPVSGITTDIDGDTRSYSTPDIGADEFTIQPNDAELYAINSPNSVAPVGVTQIKVAIRNVGTSNLLIDSLHYSINNGPVTSIGWTGNLPPLSIDSLILIGSQNFSVGTYTVKAWSSFPNYAIDLNKSNDTLIKTFTIQQMPSIVVSPLSISATTTACNDSVIVPMKIKNTGNAILNYTIDSSNVNSLSVVVLTYGVSSVYYQTITSSLGQTFTNYTTTMSYASNVATLQNDIAGKDVIIVPFMSSSSYLSTFTSFASTLQNFVSNGGSIIYAGQNYANYLNNTGLWNNMTYAGYSSSGSSITKNAHSITNNISSSELYNNSDYYYFFTGTPSNYVSLLSTGGSKVAGYKPYGNGYVFYMGFRYRYTNRIAQSKLISNTLDFIYNNGSNWLKPSTNAGSINAGDSAIVNVKLNSLGLQQGVYISSLKVRSNDLANALVNVPCTLTVIGTPTIASQTSSVNFGSQFTNMPSYDSVQVFNTGCGNLTITNIGTSNSAYSVVSYDNTLAPGDSTWIKYKFLTSTAGAYVATSTITSNASNYTIYLTGNTTSPPQITATPNPINVTITNCNDSIITNLQIQNTGGGNLIATVNQPSDSSRIIMLTYGTNSSYNSKMVNSFGTNFSKYSYTSLNTTTASVLQNRINSFNANVIVIPYVGSSYTNYYSSLSTTLQNFTNAGGTVIISGGYYDNIFTSTGLISATRIGNGNNKTMNVQNSNDPLTLNFPSTINSGSEYIIYFNFTGTGITSLLKYNGYDVAVRKSYGSGQVIVLGYYYYATPSGYTHNRQILSNSIKSAAVGVDWIDYTTSTAYLSAGTSALKAIKFKSAGLATGTYTASIKITTNAPSSPIVFVPCTLTVQNQMSNSVDLGNDTTTCGPVIINAGSGYSTYLWNTGNTTQAITAVSTGTYSVTVGSGACSSSDTINVTVINNSTLSISGLPTSTCNNTAPMAITGFPAGGVFSGTGISGNTFNPTLAGIGLHTITYTYTGSGCNNSTTQQVVVNPSPTVSFTGLSSSYCPTDPASILTGSPAGGSFSGTGVISNVFYPTIAGLGSHSIVYTYNAPTGCGNSDTNLAIVGNTSININFIINQTVFCSDDAPITVFATPAGGTLSGSGISGNVFYPNIAGIGSHYIKYLVTSTTTCDAIDSVQVIVKAAPNGLNIVGLPQTFCQSSAPINLVGYPSGGTFSGFGMNGSTFSPANANVGSHAITYNVVNSNGCSASIIDTAHVLAPPIITFTNMQSTYCENDNAFSIVVTPSGGTLSGSELTGSIFNPSSSGAGTYPIYYSYTDANNCSNNDSFNIVVSTAPNAIINSITNNFCSTSPAVSLSGTPAGGVFSGNGVSGTSFNPSVAGTGTHYVKYKFIDNNGCYDIDSTTAVVNQVHGVNAGSDVSVSYNNSTTLSGIISGGTGPFSFSWTPVNKVSNASQLSTSTTNLTTSTAFTLSVTDNSNSCVNNDQVVITVTGGVLAGSAQANPSTICEGESSQILALGSGGANTNYTYSWTSDPIGFTSSISNPTVSPIVNTTYTCTIGDGTDTVNKHIVVNVNASPNVSINNLNTVYCNDDLSVQLTVTPPGGVITGGGISGFNFDPSSASLGQNTVIYSVTGSNGCYGADTIMVLVSPRPAVFAGNDTILPCANNGVNLGQQPINGVSYQWTPTTGLSNANIANPASTINMSMNYTLTATNDASGCNNSDNISIQVTGAPTAVVSNDTTICISTSATLSASGGNTYFWSNGAVGNTTTVSPSISTLYYVIASAGGCSNLDTVWVFVNNPKPNLGADTSVCANQSITLDAGAGNASYQWSNGSSSQTVTIDSLGIGLASITLDVDVVDNLGCTGKDTIMVTFVDCTGLNNIDDNNFIISIYPNPTKGLFTINSNETKLNNLNLEIMDLNGRIIINKELKNTNGIISEQIDLSHKPKGVYIVRLVNGSLIKTFKVVVQ